MIAIRMLYVFNRHSVAEFVKVGFGDGMDASEFVNPSL